MDILPDEIIVEIFSYLDYQDLWKCLGICQRWRNIASTNKLWKPLCNKVGISIPPQSSALGIGGLSEWATAYCANYFLARYNWKHGYGKEYSIPLESSWYIQEWEGNSLALYFYEADHFQLHEFSIHGIHSCQFSTVFPNINRGLYGLSMGLSKNHLVISNRNVGIIFERFPNSFQKLKMFYTSDDKLRSLLVEEHNEKKIEEIVLSSDICSIKVEAVTKNTLWLSGDGGSNYAVIDFINYIPNIIPALDSFLYSECSSFVAIWDEEITLVDNIFLYDSWGNKVLSLRRRCWKVCFNSKILVIGNKGTQSVETWLIKTKKQLVSKNVLFFTDFDIHPSIDLVVLAEKSMAVYRLTCIDAVNGKIIWTILPPTEQRCHSLSFQLDYVFFTYSYQPVGYGYHLAYNILDMRSGKSVRSGHLSNGRAYFHSTFWAFTEKERVKIFSFMRLDKPKKK